VLCGAGILPPDALLFRAVNCSTLGVSVAGLGTVQISGEFLDHLPAFELLPQEALDPGPNEFRIFSPILIKDNRVIAKMTCALGRDEGTDPAVILYVPQEGRFVFAPIAFDGAVPARLQQNQIRFTVDARFTC
jgi:hypothetical protein